MTPFLDPNGDPAERYILLAKAAEYVFVSSQELQTESKDGKSVQKDDINYLVDNLSLKFKLVDATSKLI